MPIRLKSCSIWRTPVGPDVCALVTAARDWLAALIRFQKAEVPSNLLAQSLPHPPAPSPLHGEEALVQVDYAANWVRVEEDGWIWVFQNKHEVEELAHLSERLKTWKSLREPGTGTGTTCSL